MIAIINYNMGNLRSVEKAFKRIDEPCIVTNDHETISNADRILLPGVGHFKNGMAELEKSGLIPLIKELAFERKKPFLGICLGMQLLSNFSEEGSTKGLSFIDSETKKFPDLGHLKVPHIGWNTLDQNITHPLFDGISDDKQFYFVHSYYVESTNSDNVLTETEYGIRFTSSMVRENIIGVQFHPEKSHSQGLRLLKNFASFNV